MRRSAAGAVVIASALVFAAAIFGLVLNVTAPAGRDLNRVSEIVYLCNPLLPAVFGAFLIVRRPRHPAGWLLAVVALGTAVDSICKGILHHQQYEPRQSHPPYVQWAGWIDNWTWLSYFGAIALLFLLFPDGRPQNRQWAVLTRSIIPITLTSMVLLAGVRTNPDYKGLVLPVDLGPISDLPTSVAAGIVIPVIFGTVVLSAIALILRRRRSVGAERAQLRWLLWAAGVEVGLTLLTSLTGQMIHWGPNARLISETLDVTQELAFFGIPAAIFIAVSRHGLFEIDKVVSRTASYAMLTATLLACYVAVVAGISAAVPVDLGRLPVAAATLVVAVVFVPLRRRVGHAVDHRFNRSRYDAEQVIAGFAERVRVAAAQDVTSEELVSAVRQVLQPAHASVWLVPSKRSS